jgi:hypothetical protein
MSRIANQILEQFRQLPLGDQREVAQAILTECHGQSSGGSRRSLGEVLGKFKPLAQTSEPDHNHWVAEAIISSKGSSEFKG